MIAACTPLPVIGVPVKGSTLDGMDSLLSIVQMVRLIFILICCFSLKELRAWELSQELA
jgi:phosphoribosylcarboxyaminoimidazole (NCAIR) mutase